MAGQSVPMGPLLVTFARPLHHDWMARIDTRLKLRRKLRSLRQFPLADQLLMLPVWLLLGLSRAAVLVVPFRRLAPHLGQLTGVAPWQPLLTPPQHERALRLGRVIRAMSRYTPWNSNCFAQAITACLLLRRSGVPYTLFFGLQRSGTETLPMRAHAWLMAGPLAVTGGYCFAEYTVVACFASAAPSPVVRAPSSA